MPDKDLEQRQTKEEQLVLLLLCWVPLSALHPGGHQDKLAGDSEFHCLSSVRAVNRMKTKNLSVASIPNVSRANHVKG